LAREALTVIIRLAGQAPRRCRPLSSNVRRHENNSCIRMKTRPPPQVVASVALLLLGVLSGLVVWSVSIASLGGPTSVVRALAHPWLAVPLFLELSVGLATTLAILRRWRWARLALLLALLLSLPDLIPSEARASGELLYPLGVWFAWFSVLLYAGALALLYGKSAGRWFQPSRAAGGE